MRGRVRGGVLLLAVLLAGGCASLPLAWGSGSSGELGDYDRRIRSLLRRDRHAEALRLVSPGEARLGDELLRLQYEGLVAHYSGDHARSSDALERAFQLGEDRYTRSVSRALLSVLTSDRVLAYRPPFPEQLFLHYYGALNYLERGRPDEAAVEARRLGVLLEKALEKGGPRVPPDLGSALSRFAGAVFEAAGAHNDAGVSYRRARVFRPEPPADSAGRHRPAAAPDTDSAHPAVEIFAGRSPAPPPAVPRPDSVAAGAPDAGPVGEVLVVIERGFVAHRVERDLTLLLLPGEWRELRHLRRGVMGEEEAGPHRILELAERVEARSFGSRHRHRAKARASGVEDPVLVRVAWPEYREWPLSTGSASLRIDDRLPPDAASRWETDLSHAVREAYRERRTLDVAKTLFRAAAKAAVAEGIEDAVSGEDETLGEIAGWSARIAGALLERADTRGWHLLPARLEAIRVRLPAGTHRLSVALPASRGAGRRIDLGSVVVEPGGIAVLSTRIWE